MVGDSVSFDQERQSEQSARAHQVAYELAGKRLTRGLERAILALVQSVESDAGSVAKSPGPAPGAKQVLVKTVPVQESLW